MAKKANKTQASGYKRGKITFEGKIYYISGRTQAELEANREKRLAELRSGCYKKSVDLTIDEYQKRRVANREGQVKESTIRNQNKWYKTISDMAIDKIGTRFGDLKLIEIERQNVIDLQIALKKARKKDGSPKYSTNTINCYINLVKHILNDALDDEIIQKNVASRIKNLQRIEPEARNTKHRALTIEETERFLEAAADSWYLNLYKFMLCTGCRVGECGAIRRSDINKVLGTISINKTITKTEYGDTIGDSAKTSAGNRVIPLTTAARQATEAQIRLNESISGIIEIDGLIFTSINGSLLNEDVVNRDINNICKKSLIDKFTSHALRDTFATRAIENGMNPKTLQEIMGHNDYKITMNLYGHVMEETKEKEMNAIDFSYVVI